MTSQPYNSSRRRLLVLAALLPMLAAIGILAPRARAADALQVAINSPSPEQGIPLELVFSGTSTATNNEGRGPALLAVVRPTGGVGCQADFADDHSAAGGVSTELFGGWGNEPAQGPGEYDQTATYDPPNTGPLLICAWLESESNDGERAVVAGPASVTFDVGAPQVSQLSVGLPHPALPNVAFQVSYTTHTDQKLSMSSAIRPAGGLPCAASQSLDSDQNQSETSLLGDPDWDTGESIFGGPITTMATTTEPAGPYVICTWIEGPNTNEVDAANTTDIYVGTPSPPPLAPQVVHATTPRLSLVGVRVSKRHGTVIRGSGAATLTGHLRVSVSCGTASVNSDARVVHGAFQLALTTPRGCRRNRTARVTATWPGSRAFLKQSVSESVKVAS